MLHSHIHWRLWLGALVLITACSDDSPPPNLNAIEVADLVTHKTFTDCPALQGADGWIETTASKKAGINLTNENILVVDRRARRTFERKKSHTGDGGTSFLAATRADGTWRRCFSPGADHCALEKGDAIATGPSETTLAFDDYGDFNQPNHGGAALALDPNPSDIDGATWKLSVTPAGGVPYILQIARDGAILAVDLPWIGTRTANLAWADFNGCRVASERESILSGKTDRETKITNFEVRPAMTPADTPTEGDVRMP